MYEMEFSYVDRLVDKGDIQKALKKCDRRWKDSGSCEWAMKFCEVLEIYGDFAQSRDVRELIATDKSASDEVFFKNFDLMPKLYTKRVWKDVEAILVRTMKGDKFSPLTCSRRYVRYLEKKGDIDELYNICLYQPALLDELIETLRPRYEKELGLVFEKYILDLQRHGSYLKLYEETCELFKKYHGLGVDVTGAMAKLRDWYGNRKKLMKMLDELELG